MLSGVQTGSNSCLSGVIPDAAERRSGTGVSGRLLLIQ